MTNEGARGPILWGLLISWNKQKILCGWSTTLVPFGIFIHSVTLADSVGPELAENMIKINLGLGLEGNSSILLKPVIIDLPIL